MAGEGRCYHATDGSPGATAALTPAGRPGARRAARRERRRARPSPPRGSPGRRRARGRGAASSAARRGRPACPPRSSRRSSWRSSENAALSVTAASASSSDRPIAKQPRAIANGSEGERPPPGFTSEASATGAPAVDQRARRREAAEAQVEGGRGQQRGDARRLGQRPHARLGDEHQVVGRARAAARPPARAPPVAASSSAWIRSFRPVRARREQDAPALLHAEDALLAEDVGEDGEAAASRPAGSSRSRPGRRSARGRRGARAAPRGRRGRSGTTVTGWRDAASADRLERAQLGRRSRGRSRS